MSEQVIQSLLLALHNIASVGCAAAPFYNRQLVNQRGRCGPTLHYKVDKVVEDTLQGDAPYCIVFITMLWITGLGIRSRLNPVSIRGSFGFGVVW